MYDLHYIVGPLVIRCILSACKSDPLPYDLPLFIDAASEERLRSGDYLIDQLCLGIFIQVRIPCKPADLFHYRMLESYDPFVIRNHFVITIRSRRS